MRKRLSVVLLVVVLMAVVLFPSVSCGSDFDPNAITLMGKASDLQKPYMTRIFEHFKQVTGENINVVAIEDSDFEKEASARMKTDDAPDILMHFHNADLNRFDAENNFVFLNDEEWVSDLTDSAKNYCTDKGGHLLGLPFWESSVSGCYYNKTLFKKFDLRPATNQKEFDMLCQTMADLGLTPICWPANGCAWMFQFGLDPLFADDPQLLADLNDGKIDYADIPKVRDMLQWIKNAADKGWFGNKYNNIGWDGISAPLANGDAVMTFIWDTWFYTDFHNGKYSKEDFGVMPVFMGTAYNGTYEGGNLNMMMVNKNSKKKDKALEFLRFCAEAENYNAAFDGIATISCFKGQTTNVESTMVKESQDSIKKYERVSTASTRVVGYSGDDVAACVSKLLSGEWSVDRCLKEMDDLRKEKAREYGSASD